MAWFYALAAASASPTNCSVSNSTVAWTPALIPYEGWLGWYLLNNVLVHLPSLVRIEPELHHNDSPTYTTQARAWECQSNTRIACLASVRHTGQVCATTSAEQSAHTHRCPQGTSASNLPTTAALRQMQHSFSAASASTKGPTFISLQLVWTKCAPHALICKQGRAICQCAMINKYGSL
jgi:hypothetical protein